MYRLLVLRDQNRFLAEVGHQRQAIQIEEIAAEDVDVGKLRAQWGQMTSNEFVGLDVQVHLGRRRLFGHQCFHHILGQEGERTSGIDEENDVDRTVVFVVVCAAAIFTPYDHIDQHNSTLTPDETRDGEFARERSAWSQVSKSHCLSVPGQSSDVNAVR